MRGTTQRYNRREEILPLLHERGELTRAEIAESLGLSDVAARKWLPQLRAENRVDLTTANPRSRHARYRIAGTG